jgi:hypothetical protein
VCYYMTLDLEQLNVMFSVLRLFFRSGIFRVRISMALTPCKIHDKSKALFYKDRRGPENNKGKCRKK